jgi:hypothetical protein
MLRDFFLDGKGRIMTEWVDDASMQRVFEEFAKSGYTAVLSEHKVERGQSWFRYGFKDLDEAFPGVRPVPWYCYSGLTKDSFDQRNDELLKGGYVLMYKQVSDGAGGESCICGIWAKPPPAPKQ